MVEGSSPFAGDFSLFFSIATDCMPNCSRDGPKLHLVWFDGNAGWLCRGGSLTVQWYNMINNYFEHQYRASDKIYTHQQSGKSIFLGDISSALDLEFIKRQQIQTVVTAAVGMDHVQYDSSVNHIVYPLLDMKSQNITKYFTQFYELMEKQLARRNILVHCAAGISRSSTLIIAYLMKKKCWGFKEAITYVRQARPNVCPNLGFERQLKQYEISLNRQAEMGFQRRFGSKTSQQRKHMPSPSREKVLPEIAMMGRTQLKPKLLDLFAIEPIIKPTIQQYSRNSSKHRHKEVEEIDFYGTKKLNFRPIKSRSIPDKPIEHPLNFRSSPIYRNESREVGSMKGSMPLQKLQDMMVQRMNLNNNSKLATQRQIRMKQLHKIAYY